MPARTLGQCELREVLCPVSPPGTNKVSVSVENDGLALVVHPEGYGVYDTDEAAPILLERHQGKLRLIVWADINEEDPTHIIDLEGAKNTQRNEDCSFDGEAADDDDNEHDYPREVQEYDGPFQSESGSWSSISIVEIDKDLYDLYGDDDGDCLNLGCPFPFIPTREEVAEFVLTGKIKGKIE